LAALFFRGFSLKKIITTCQSENSALYKVYYIIVFLQPEIGMIIEMPNYLLFDESSCMLDYFSVQFLINLSNMVN